MPHTIVPIKRRRVAISKADEMTVAMRELKLGKAPGPDDIMTKFLTLAASHC